MTKLDYYEILGVDKNASADEIKKAFRRQAVTHHPDRGGDETKFKQLNEAHEVLSNPEKKQRYDQFGHAGVGGDGAGFGGFGQGQEFHFDFGDGSLGDIIGSFFGGQRSSKAQRTRDIEVTVSLSFEEAVFGVEKEIKLSLNDVCKNCRGSRAEPGKQVKTCDGCQGAGQTVKLMRTVFGNIQQPAVCAQCQGEGDSPEQDCSDCRGQGTSKQTQTVSLKIPAGIDDGVTIRLREYGDKNRRGQAGDLYAIIRVKAHKRFTREGDLILSEQTIDMAQAALGAEVEVMTVDGPIKMKIPAGTQSGTDFKLAKHGVPHLRDGGRGAHIVNIIVKTPTKLNRRQKDLLELLATS